MEITEIIGNYKNFLSRVIKNLEAAEISFEEFDIDHIAYRAVTIDSYLAKLAELGEVAELLDEIIIRNRSIAVFKLFRPIRYKNFIIPYVELMAPAEGDKFIEGLEHAEFVINSSLDEFKEKYPNLNFIFKDRKINPELVLKFVNGANIKFHLRDIETVIRLQNESENL